MDVELYYPFFGEKIITNKRYNSNRIYLHCVDKKYHDAVLDELYSIDLDLQYIKDHNKRSKIANYKKKAVAETANLVLDKFYDAMKTALETNKNINIHIKGIESDIYTKPTVSRFYATNPTLHIWVIRMIWIINIVIGPVKEKITAYSVFSSDNNRPIYIGGNTLILTTTR